MSEELARVFDEVFTQPIATERPPEQRLLAVRVAGEPYAWRLAEVAAVVKGKAITPLPGAAQDLLGIAGFRGNLVSVFDLRGLLGYSSPPPPGCLVLTNSRPRVALAFDSLDGDLRVSPEQILSEANRLHVNAVVTVNRSARPVLDLNSILDAIARRTRKS